MLTSTLRNTDSHAFQAIRAAIATSQSIDTNAISPDSRLENFFPRKERRERINAFQSELGLDIDMMSVRNSLEWVIIVSALGSFAALFFSWELAVAGLVLTGLLSWVSTTFGQTLTFATVGQLSEQISREHISDYPCAFQSAPGTYFQISYLR